MHVLHLLDQAGPQAAAAALALMAQTLDGFGRTKPRVVLMGNANLQHDARRAGVRHAVRLATPFGRAMFAWPAFRGRCGGDNAAGSLPHAADLVHCWSIESLTLAALMLRHMPRVLTLTADPSPGAVRWLRILCRDASGPTVLLASSAAIHRTLLTGGVPERAARLLRPGVDAELVDQGARADIRRGWGVDSDNVKVVAILDDPPHTADAATAAVVIMLAADAYEGAAQPIRLLVNPRQANLRAARRRPAGLGRRHWLICDDRLDSPHELVPAVDLGLVTGPQATALSTLWAVAAGVPIVGEASDAISSIVRHGQSAMLTSPRDRRSLAHGVKQLIDDPRLAQRLAETARSSVRQAFSCDQYRRSVQAVYDRIQGEKAPIAVD